MLAPHIPKHSHFPKHTTYPKTLSLTKTVLKTTGIFTLATLITLATLFTLYIKNLTENIQSNTLTLNTTPLDNNTNIAGTPTQINIQEYESGFNILIYASDTREGQNIAFGEEGGNLADVIMLATVTKNHDNISIVSFPRDLMVDVPTCTDPETGTTHQAAFKQINSTLNQGGPSCVVSTIENITGTNIEFVAAVDFEGVVHMSNTIGGVEVCLSEPINDTHTGLNLNAGTHTLQGIEATQFLRLRYGVGDGSDLGRIGVQQLFLSSLIRKIKSDDTLTNPIRLLNLATVVSENVSLSNNLTNIYTIASLGKVFQNINLENVTFLKVPTIPGGQQYPNRVLLQPQQTATLFELINTEQPLILPQNNTGNSIVPTTPTPPTTTPPTQLENVTGQKASDITCTQ